MNSISAGFRQGGFNFRLIERIGDVALFAKSKPNNARESFEVVIVQQRPAETICGREYPARESLPSPEDWGTRGWSYSHSEPAKRKFRALVKDRQEDHFQPTPTENGAFSSSEGVRTVEAGL